ncbi:MAG: sugar transferase [Sphingomonas bacterium]|uniref:sugar transferase n=1 Tax=Sphingomonas bacterium TaxID=1895847 RepID=UPI002630429A|nr:sugar transferase [Sphingomonas bacterium]MDB5703911.1 sugar transferase [Sphingomonas bacterium]
MMLKRAIDILVSVLVLIFASPILLGAMFLVWRYDRHSPLYHARRVGKGNHDFMMIKLRSMTIDAEARGGTSTAASDRRITPAGHMIRRYKLDELSQFWNVLRGDMSIVGPRPNARDNGVDRYTPEEMRLLSIRPGITDLSSIVFSDEGDILTGAADPDALYDAVIRPWKSRLGLLYVERHTLAMDLRIIWLTAVAIVAKPVALRGVDAILAGLGAGDELRAICARTGPPPRGVPPGVPA